MDSNFWQILASVVGTLTALSTFFLSLHILKSDKAKPSAGFFYCKKVPNDVARFNRLTPHKYVYLCDITAHVSNFGKQPTTLTMCRTFVTINGEKRVFDKKILEQIKPGEAIEIEVGATLTRKDLSAVPDIEDKFTVIFKFSGADDVIVKGNFSS